MLEQERQMKNDMVIIVDENDNEIGQCDKYSAHRISANPKLHRAFSLFLFNKEGKLLLQQRSKNKLTFPMIWANSCCSHPSPGESILHAVVRRAKFELNLELHESELHEVNTLTYRADWNEWAEWEIDHLVVGKSDNDIHPNPEEVNDIKWVTEEELADYLTKTPELFSPWIRYVFEKKLIPKY